MRRLQIALLLISGASLTFQGAESVAAQDRSDSSRNQTASTTFTPNFFHEMRWRCIGPFRGGRTVAISGVAKFAKI